MIKRFKFLVIILVLSISSISSCGDFEENIYTAIDTYTDFSSLTPEQEACYLSQISRLGLGPISIYWAVAQGNVSAFKWLLSKGVVPAEESFKNAVSSDNPKAEIVSELIKLGLYCECIHGRPTLEWVQRTDGVFAYYVRHATMYPRERYEAEKIVDLIKQHENRWSGKDGLRAAWIGAVVRSKVSSEFGYGAGAGSDFADESHAGAGAGAASASHAETDYGYISDESSNGEWGCGCDSDEWACECSCCHCVIS